jgi:hypothetical protein
MPKSTKRAPGYNKYRNPFLIFSAISILSYPMYRVFSGTDQCLNLDCSPLAVNMLAFFILGLFIATPAALILGFLYMKNDKTKSSKYLAISVMAVMTLGVFAWSTS